MLTPLYILALLTLTLLYAESRPLTFDDLDKDITHLAYEVEEEDLDDYIDQLEAERHTTKPPKPKVQASGFKKNNKTTQGVKGKADKQNVKKIFNIAAAKNQGDFDDENIYASIDGIAGKGVSITGNEDRKYRKGTKTRGFHRVHHKDEYKKDKVIYEDDETSGKINKVGAKGYGIKIGGGLGFNKGHYRRNQRKGIQGKRGSSESVSFDKELDQFANSQGFDGTFNAK